MLSYTLSVIRRGLGKGQSRSGTTHTMAVHRTVGSSNEWLWLQPVQTQTDWVVTRNHLWSKDLLGRLALANVDGNLGTVVGHLHVQMAQMAGSPRPPPDQHKASV